MKEAIDYKNELKKIKKLMKTEPEDDPLKENERLKKIRKRIDDLKAKLEGKS